MSEIAPELMAIFEAEARELLDEIAGLAREPESEHQRHTIHRRLHTLKGNAQSLGLLALADVVHAAEDSVKHGASTLGITDAIARIDETLANLGESSVEVVRVPLGKIDELSRRITELTVLAGNLAILTETAMGSESSPALRSQELLGKIRLSYDAIHNMRLVKAGGLRPTLQNAIAHAAARRGNQAMLGFTGGDCEIDHHLLARLREPLLHLVRNCVAHGIESPDVRMAAGKQPVGRIEVSFTVDRYVTVTVRDNGRGIDFDRLRAKCEGHALPDTELIFMDGLSATDEVDEIAGRGVGMGVVRRSLEEMRGTLELVATGPQGTEFRLRVPATMTTVEALEVQAGAEAVLIPVDAVEHIAIGAEALISELPGTERIVEVDDSLYPLVNLGRLLGFGDSTEQALVLTSVAGRRAALAVDAVTERRLVVVRNLQEDFRRVQGVLGVTVSAAGTPQLILDPNHLVAGGA